MHHLNRNTIESPQSSEHHDADQPHGAQIQLHAELMSIWLPTDEHKLPLERFIPSDPNLQTPNPSKTVCCAQLLRTISWMARQCRSLWGWQSGVGGHCM